MRRIAFVPLVVVALAVAGCTAGSHSGTTVTVINTVTSAPRTSGTGPSVTVVDSSAPTTTAPKTSKSTPAKTTVKTTPAAPIVHVNPLSADCGELLAPSDVSRAIGATIPSGFVRLKLAGDSKVGATGRIRCRYASTDNGLTSKVSALLTQYTSAKAAAAQLAVTIQYDSVGAVSSRPTVAGRPAYVLLKQGGLILLQYDTWTLAIAIADQLASNAKLAAGLPVLASQVLARVIKNG